MSEREAGTLMLPSDKPRADTPAAEARDRGALLLQAADRPQPDAGVPDLSVRSISYVYPTGTVALADISLTIKAGEFVSVLGPSGSGKSTLMSIISGTLKPASGDIVWGSPVDARRGRPRQRQLSMVFQRDTVLPWLSVEKNVGLGLRYLDLSAQERKERVDRLIEIAGLSDFRKTPPHQLSGGMRRRVALLAGVATLPKLLLMDEPFSGLDEPTRVHVHEDLRKIFSELGLSVLLVTHDLSEALTLSDKIYIFSARPGRVVSEITVPFGPDRDLMAVREERQYQDLYSLVWERLSREIAKTRG